MMLTTVEATGGTASLKALACGLMPSMKWRHHGIGVLQGYVAEDAEPEVRIHIWSPRLLKPGMDESGDIHDHRFDLVSHVLVGTVGHEEILPFSQDGGGWTMLALTHARAAKETGYHGPTKELGGQYRINRLPMLIPAGRSYRFPAGAFHRSPVAHIHPGGIVVTVVEKHRQSAQPARILYPVDKPPVMAFGHDMDWAVVGPVMQLAAEALRGR
jgi:hypothetical protein